MIVSDLAALPALWATLRHPIAYLRARRARPRQARYDIELRDGHVVRLRGLSRDFHVFHRIFVDDEYRLKGLDLAGARVIDIGAHGGFFALRAAFAGARVICAEPAPDNLQLLRHNIQRNRLEDRITVRATAVCARAGRVTLCCSGDPYAHHVAPALATENTGPERITVEATTLGALMEEHGVETCALLKLDCEGSEFEILAGATPAVLRRIDRVRLEFHVPPDEPEAPEDLRRHLESAGLTVESMVTKKSGRQGYLFCRRESARPSRD
jgi:FkbM family methyltransferase